MNCPLKDTTLCRVSSSVELVAGRGVLQHNCSTCGSGCAETVSREVAEALLAELNAHRPPPAEEPGAPEAAQEAGDQEPVAELSQEIPLADPPKRKRR